MGGELTADEIVGHQSCPQRHAIVRQGHIRWPTNSSADDQSHNHMTVTLHVDDMEQSMIF